MSETNLIDVILGVSVETDDDYGSLDDLLDKLNRLSRVGSIDIATERDAEEIADTTSKAVDSNLRRRTEALHGDIRDTQQDVLDAKSTLWNKIDQIWRNIAVNTRMLRGSTGRLTAAESMMTDPEGVLRAQGVSELYGRGTKNVSGLARVLGDIDPNDIKENLLDVIRLAGQYVKVMEMTGRYGLAERMKGMVEQLKSGKEPIVETKQLENIVKTLFPEIAFHVATGAKLSQAGIGRAVETSRMRVGFEERGWSMYYGSTASRTYEKSKQEFNWTDQEMAALSKMQRESADLNEFEQRFALEFGESLDSFVSSRNMLGVIPDYIAGKIAPKGTKSSVPFDMSIIMKEALTQNLTEGNFRDAFIEVLQKQGGEVDEDYIDAILTPLFERAKRGVMPGEESQIIGEAKASGGIGATFSDKTLRKNIEFLSLLFMGPTAKTKAVGVEAAVGRPSEQTFENVIGEVTQEVIDDYAESRALDVESSAEALEIQVRDLSNISTNGIQDLRTRLENLQRALDSLLGRGP
jgi:NTP pyrophosphatase (non-canonical NTP hydrolase)